MNKILIPFDFSESAENALDFGLQLAEKSSAKEVLLLNVIEHPSESRLKYMGVTPADPLQNVYFTELIQVTKEKLEEKIENLDSGSIKVKYKIQLGSPYNTLVAEVSEEDVDLVIMGTEGAEGLDELFVGSNSEKVVRNAKCPVITIREPAKVEDINSIVFASNFHELKYSFVDRIKELQNMMGATLKIVKINTPAAFTTQRHDLKQMNEFVKNYDIQDYTIEIYNYTNEEDGIVYYAEDVDADMVALGTSQRTGFDHFLLGSIAEDVVNHSKRPVWTMSLEG